MVPTATLGAHRFDVDGDLRRLENGWVNSVCNAELGVERSRRKIPYTMRIGCVVAVDVVLRDSRDDSTGAGRTLSVATQVGRTHEHLVRGVERSDGEALDAGSEDDIGRHGVGVDGELRCWCPVSGLPCTAHDGDLFDHVDDVGCHRQRGYEVGQKAELDQPSGRERGARFRPAIPCPASCAA